MSQVRDMVPIPFLKVRSAIAEGEKYKTEGCRSDINYRCLNGSFCAKLCKLRK